MFRAVIEYAVSALKVEARGGVWALGLRGDEGATERRSRQADDADGAELAAERGRQRST